MDIKYFYESFYFNKKKICFMLLFHPTVYHSDVHIEETHFSTHIYHFI